MLSWEEVTVLRCSPVRRTPLLTRVMRRMAGSSWMFAAEGWQGWKGLEAWDAVLEASEVQGSGAALLDFRLWYGLTTWLARRDACRCMQM